MLSLQVLTLTRHLSARLTKVFAFQTRPLDVVRCGEMWCDVVRCGASNENEDHLENLGRVAQLQLFHAKLYRPK